MFYILKMFEVNINEKAIVLLFVGVGFSVVGVRSSSES